MNFTGRGKAAGSVIYLCVGCVSSLRAKELWQGQIVRTSDRGFGFLQLVGRGNMPHLRFEHGEVAEPGRQTPSRVEVGDFVLVLLADDARHARRIWRLRPACRQNGSPHVNGSATRGVGVVTATPGHDWGFITELQTGNRFFVHQSDLRAGARIALGDQVTFLPTSTTKGPRAIEVRRA
jgi:cold shock CspA family protein